MFGEGPTYDKDILSQRDRSFKQAQALVGRVAQRLQAAGFRTTTQTPDQDPRRGIIECAVAWNADLIVMGSHGRRGLDRLLLGSVAEAVMRHASCSVEIVRLPPSTLSPTE
jgi:nucleotide-binding universal stress UspA family protein